MLRTCLSALVLLAACGESQAPRPRTYDEASARVQAEKATNALMTALMGRLKPALEEGGAAGALHVCADVAQEIEAQVRLEWGVGMRRTSLRVRNPANRPDAWEQAWLERAQAQAGTRLDPVADVVAAAGGARELRYVRPIYLQPLCAQCHGAEEALGPGVRAALAERYPEDRATGFAPGDLRGIVSVRVPLG